MKVLHTVLDLRTALQETKEENKSIGFVPTMGALHAGHIALATRSVRENDVSVVSIFVNPTQFNDKNDLKNYPRTLEADLSLLLDAGVDFVFVPSVEDIYPEPDSREFDFDSLATVMEGKFRPGHFNGVAQVVSRLFEIVQPTYAYFGEKDFQQLAIIREMTRQLGFNIEIVPCPIVREEDGLAMSSRNRRLNEDLRLAAPQIFQALFESKNNFKTTDVEETKSQVIDKINAIPDFEVEYFDIVDGNTLQTINNWDETNYAVGCIAVFTGDIRLIDNIIYKK